VEVLVQSRAQFDWLHRDDLLAGRTDASGQLDVITDFNWSYRTPDVRKAPPAPPPGKVIFRKSGFQDALHQFQVDHLAASSGVAELDLGHITMRQVADSSLAG
jgi:hypothetical protein